MYVDAELQFSSAQAVTSTAASTNLIDLGVAINNLGLGETLHLVIQVTVAALNDSSGTDATVTVALETHTAADFSSARTVVDSSVATFAHGNAVGTRRIYKLPAAPSNDFLQYIALRYTVANGPLDAGAFDAFLTKDIQKFVAYADGITIS